MLRRTPPLNAALAISEPEGGSDVRNLRTTARRSGPERTPTGANLLGGQDKLEHELARAREVVAGAKHSGSATLGTFEQTRPMVAAQALGIARAALEYVTEYANRREAFGAPIIDNQGIAFPLADLATRIDARPPSHLAGVVDGRHRSAVRPRRGVDVETGGQRGRGRLHRAGHPDDGWLGVHQGPPRREVVPGCQVVHHLRGHQRDSAHRHPHALGAADGKPPMHVDLEPTGGPLNAMFGRGTPARTRAANTALALRDRVPQPIMQLAMKVLRPPRK